MLCAQIITEEILERAVSMRIVQTRGDSNDIIIPDSGIVSFQSGNDDGDMNCIEVASRNDTILEDDEEFQFSIDSEGSDSGVIRVIGEPVSIIVIDDDSKLKSRVQASLQYY